MAQLILDGKHYGPHAFIVPIRDMKTHEPLPGITVGDVGPKFGLNTLDNGFLLFNNVRIPHENMLAKYAHISKETGVYEKPPNAKVGYGTMTWVRANIVMYARLVIARAATVAIRYTAVRRQFGDKDAPIYVRGQILETPTLDYTMVQYRLLPLIAQSFALQFTGDQMSTEPSQSSENSLMSERLYMKNQKEMAGGNFGLLADLHASSTGLKSLTSSMAAEAIELARRACGGHGFSMFSGLVHFYQDYRINSSSSLTNNSTHCNLGRRQVHSPHFLNLTVVTCLLNKWLVISLKQQDCYKKREAMFLPLHQILQLSISKVYTRLSVLISAYMKNPGAKCPVRRIGDLRNNELLLQCFGHRAAYMVEHARHLRDIEHRSWNSLLVEFYRMSVGTSPSPPSHLGTLY